MTNPAVDNVDGNGLAGTFDLMAATNTSDDFGWLYINTVTSVYKTPAPIVGNGIGSLLLAVAFSAGGDGGRRPPDQLGAA
jgi:hypothetical protein